MKLLAISGSLRADSLNTKLVKEAVRVFGEADVEFGSLRMPLYDGDLEDKSGAPAEALTLAKQIADADAIVISSPEYNQGVPGVVKNALDWVSRTDGNPWAGKPVALVHATAGRSGGARANYALRLVMAPFNTRLLQGPEILVAGAMKEFDENNVLANELYLKNLTKLMSDLRASV